MRIKHKSATGQNRQTKTLSKRPQVRVNVQGHHPVRQLLPQSARAHANPVANRCRHAGEGSDPDILREQDNPQKVFLLPFPKTSPLSSMSERLSTADFLKRLHQLHRRRGQSITSTPYLLARKNLIRTSAHPTARAMTNHSKTMIAGRQRHRMNYARARRTLRRQRMLSTHPTTRVVLERQVVK